MSVHKLLWLVPLVVFAGKVTRADLLATTILDAVDSFLWLQDHLESCNHIGTNSTGSSVSRCKSNLVCHSGQCRCPVGHLYSAKYWHFGDPKCRPFNQSQCEEHSECQDMDPNVVCVEGKCRCKSAYHSRSGTHPCEPRAKWKENTEPSTGQCWTYCDGETGCTAQYSYCHNNRCRCRPDFEFVPSGGLANASASASEEGSCRCQRKLCQANHECQTEENPNLICNNTICECRFGYAMMMNKTCIRFSRRQSCDTVCKIIGGLFASIFMVTLVYWCLYCCYSIARNYNSHHHHHRRQRRRPLHFDSSDLFFATVDGPFAPYNNRERRFTTHGSRFSLNLPTLLRFSDDPPTYAQVMADEHLPNYESAIELKTLNRTQSEQDK